MDSMQNLSKMATSRNIRFVVLIALCFCAVGLVYFREHVEHKVSDTTAVFRAEVKERTTSTGLKIIHPSNFANETDFRCLRANIENLTFPFCVYEAKADRYISKLLYSGGYFEKDLVTKFIRLLKTHDEVTFVDLGANLGTYSLPVSHLGRHVVSVEPNPDTYRRLAKSIHLGGVSSHTDAVNYALGDVNQSAIVLQIDPINRGNSFLTKNASCGSNCSVVVPSTTLQRLLPLVRNRKVVMKVDVQESEIKIFTEAAAGEFFRTVDVSMIMMEWGLYPMNYGKTESGRCRVYHFLQFFYERGYDVYDPRKENRLSADWRKWSFDVLFKKRGLPTNELFSL